MVEIDPVIALRGGTVVHRLAGGRRIRVKLPSGLRSGDTVRAEKPLKCVVLGAPEMLVRGDDLWISVQVDPRAGGGRSRGAGDLKAGASYG